jgi:hypothetical protein
LRNRFRFIAVGLAIWAVLTGSVALAQAPQVLEVGNFSSGEAGGPLPYKWKPLTFKNIDHHTAYSLVREGETVVIKAFAEASASGLVREITIDPKAFPIIRWTWKVDGVLEKADVRTKAGDDYPARIYVTFGGESTGFFGRIKDKAIEVLYGSKPPFAAINYIWASKAPVGTMVPNPYTNRAMMFVLQSGKKNLGKWVREERSLLKDFEQAFKQPPSMITGVAIMTDTDNTGESATAYYGDIVFDMTETGLRHR